MKSSPICHGFAIHPRSFPHTIPGNRLPTTLVVGEDQLQHLELVRDGVGFVCRLNDGPPVSGHRPSVDVLFRSGARAAGAKAIGVILTGMGKDGAEGLLEMRKAGASTLGQDEASSLIYGMPRVAFERGAVERQFSLTELAGAIVDRCSERQSRQMAPPSPNAGADERVTNAHH